MNAGSKWTQIGNVTVRMERDGVYLARNKVAPMFLTWAQARDMAWWLASAESRAKHGQEAK